MDYTFVCFTCGNSKVTGTIMKLFDKVVFVCGECNRRGCEYWILQTCPAIRERIAKIEKRLDIETEELVIVNPKVQEYMDEVAKIGCDAFIRPSALFPPAAINDTDEASLAALGTKLDSVETAFSKVEEFLTPAAAHTNLMLKVEEFLAKQIDAVIEGPQVSEFDEAD